VIGSGRALALLACLIAGCSAGEGLHSDRLRSVIQQEESRFFTSPAPPSTKVLVPTTPALGFYLKPTGFLHREFDWTDRDREIVLAWADGRRTEGLITNGRFVHQSSIKGDTFAELKASAARHGADLLVIFDGAASVDRYNNYKAALWYWTIVGAYVADGTQSDALCLVNVTIWDVKTGTMIFSEEAEGRSQIVGPAAIVDDEQGVLTARRQALDKILELVAQRLRDRHKEPAMKPGQTEHRDK